MLRKKIVISKRAYVSMLCELEVYPDVETGGLLLGYDINNCLYIVEATDAGKYAIREKGSLQCDMDYLKHIFSVLSRMYTPCLEQVGVWHKHNHSYEPPFSITDEELHKSMSKDKGNDILSILFQKKDEDEYRMRVFLCDERGRAEEREFEVSDLSQKDFYQYSY